MDNFSGTRQRMRCKRCNRRTTLQKLKRKDGSIIVRCNSCHGEHTIQFARKKKVK